MIRAFSENQYVRETPVKCVICCNWIIPGQFMRLVLPDHGWAHSRHDED